MLYLSRKIGESIIINNSIELTVVEVRGRTVKLGFVFPPEASVLRKEIHDKISDENRAAASHAMQDADELLSALGAWNDDASPADDGKE
jgi:carbon storage regulator